MTYLEKIKKLAKEQEDKKENGRCPLCNGQRLVLNDDPDAKEPYETCPECNGAGVV